MIDHIWIEPKSKTKVEFDIDVEGIKLDGSQIVKLYIEPHDVSLGSICYQAVQKNEKSYVVEVDSEKSAVDVTKMYNFRIVMYYNSYQLEALKGSVSFEPLGTIKDKINAKIKPSNEEKEKKSGSSVEKKTDEVRSNKDGSDNKSGNKNGTDGPNPQQKGDDKKKAVKAEPKQPAKKAGSTTKELPKEGGFKLPIVNEKTKSNDKKVDNILVELAENKKRQIESAKPVMSKEEKERLLKEALMSKLSVKSEAEKKVQAILKGLKSNKDNGKIIK